MRENYFNILTLQEFTDETEVKKAKTGKSDYTCVIKENENNHTLYASCELKGLRPTQEDRASFGILNNFSNQSENLKKELLMSAVAKIQEKITRKKIGQYQDSVKGLDSQGACLISVVSEKILKTNQSGSRYRLYTTALGDSLAFFVRIKADETVEIIRLNQKLHNPDKAEEIKRIKKAGGRTKFYKNKQNVPRLNGLHAISRSLGDNFYAESDTRLDPKNIPKEWRTYFRDNGILYTKNTDKKTISIIVDQKDITKGVYAQNNDETITVSLRGLSHIPEVYVNEIVLQEGEKGFVVLACDGLQENDAVSEQEIGQEVLENVKNNQPLENIALNLAQKAITNHSQDNVSVSIIPLEGDQTKIAGIYDGHGGDKVSEFCRVNYISTLHYLLREPKYSNPQSISNMRGLLQATISNITDKNIKEISEEMLNEINRLETKTKTKTEDLIDYMRKMGNMLENKDESSIDEFKRLSIKMNGKVSPLKILGGLGLMLVGVVGIGLGLALGITGSIGSLGALGLTAPITLYAGYSIAAGGLGFLAAGIGLFSVGVRKSPSPSANALITTLENKRS